MKYKISIVILLIFCLAEIKPLLPFFEYYMNYEYISQVLCVNKDKPIIACNGKCYLNKQLEKTQETTNKENKIILNIEWEKVLMLNDDSYEYFNFIVGNKLLKNIQSYHHFKLQNPFISLFTPPPEC